VADRQIALPQRIAAIGGGEALGDGKAIAEGLERLLQLALRRAICTSQLRSDNGEKWAKVVKFSGAKISMQSNAP
jgi:hypothetical protein